MNCTTPGLPVHHHLPEFTQTYVHRVRDAIQPSHLCHPLFLLPPIPPSIRVFPNESTLHMRWPKHWSFSFSIIPSKEHPGLISFRMDWLDLRAVQGTLKSLLQHHSSKASILRCSAFFTVQLSHPYMTIGKTIALTKWTFRLCSADGPVSVGYNSSSFLESSRFLNQNLGPGQECLKKGDKKTHFLSGLESRRLKGALESYLLPCSHIKYIYVCLRPRNLYLHGDSREILIQD